MNENVEELPQDPQTGGESHVDVALRFLNETGGRGITARELSTRSGLSVRASGNVLQRMVRSGRAARGGRAKGSNQVLFLSKDYATQEKPTPDLHQNLISNLSELIADNMELRAALVKIEGICKQALSQKE